MSLKKNPPSLPLYPILETRKKTNDFIDKLETKEVNFVGTDGDVSEFIIRFILGQLGHDWEQTIIMIREMLGDKDTLNVREQIFDCLNLFSLG